MIAFLIGLLLGFYIGFFVYSMLKIGQKKLPVFHSETETGRENRLAENIRYLRKNRGLSQTNLGRKIGVSRNTISRIEAGTWKGKFNTINNIAQYFCISLNALITADLAQR